MKQALVVLVFLIVMLALAGSAHAVSSNASVTSITVSVPEANEYIVLPSTKEKQEALVNFTYTVSGENNVSWCRLIANGTQVVVNQTIEKKGVEYFKNVGLTNGSWWYQIQCRDNYTNIFNSSNRSLTIALDDTKPTILPSNSESIYNTTTGMAVFKFVVTDYESEIDNCTLFVEGEEKGIQKTVGNNSLTNFPKFFLKEGDYTWNVMCKDKAGNIGESTDGMFVAELRTSQSISLVSPADKAMDLDGVVTFKYIPASRLPIKWCVLRLNETYNATSSEIVNNTENILEKVRVAHGPYNWSITCTDSADNNVSSAKRNLYVNVSVLVSEYLKIDASTPEDYYIMDTGLVDFTYTPTAVLGLNRCELITNRSVREVQDTGSSGEQATFADISLSEGIWEWRIRCFDNSDNEYNTQLYTLTAMPKEPEELDEPLPEEISAEVEGANVTDILDKLAGKTKSLLGISNAAWVTIVIVVLMLGIGAVVIVVDKKFELELIRDVERILYKLKIRKKPPISKKKRVLTDEHKKALKSYVTYHMRNGVPRYKIEAHLKMHKWRDEHVKTVFEELEKDWDELREKFRKEK